MTTASTLWRIGALLLVLTVAGAAQAEDPAQDASGTEIDVHGALSEALGEENIVVDPADVDLLSIQENLGDVSADLYLETMEASTATATAAAIGNSLSVDDASSLSFESGQFNDFGTIAASATVATDHPEELIEVTGAAIGNSLSAQSGSFAEAGLMQENFGQDITSLVEVTSTFGEADTLATAAAIANSATLEINGDLDLGTLQENDANLASEMFVDLTRAGEVTSVTAAAIGNSLSAEATGGYLDGLSIQAHEADTVSAGVDFKSRHGSRDLESFGVTAAAIANSATLATDDPDSGLIYELDQTSFGNVGSWATIDGPGMASSSSSLSGASQTSPNAGGTINATSAAIGNSATFKVKTPVKVQ